MRFKAVATFRSNTRESEPSTEDQATNQALAWLREGNSKTITILRDSEGADHPDNAGKFFLYRIVK